MKRHALTALVLLSSLGLGSLASARDSLFSEPNVVVGASFYSSDPSGGASLLNNVTLNNSPLGVVIPDIEDATYVTLEYGGASYTFELSETGRTKDSIELLVDGATDETMSLAALVSGLADDPALLEQL